MTDPAQRVRDLLRLAADRGAAPEEARTAAHAAAVLISRCGIAVGGRNAAGAIAELQRQLTIERAKVAQLTNELLALRTKSNTAMPWIRINAKYESHCGKCRVRIAQGDPCLYRRGNGVRCPKCNE